MVIEETTERGNKILQSSTKRKANKVRKRKIGNKDYESDLSDDENFSADFNSLNVSTLRKYTKFYNLKFSSNLNKTELVREINKHFAKISLESEKTITTYFIHFVKCSKDEKDDES